MSWGNEARGAAILVLWACAGAGAAGGAADSLAAKVARRYGVEGFPAVSRIDYAFHVKMKGLDIARRWTWFPGPDSVVFLNQGKPAPGPKGPDSLAYKRGAALAGDAAQVDKWFVNDQYWLLFPFHLRWDAMAGLSLSSRAPDSLAPAGTRDLLTAAYPKQGGYTPGDAYDLYLAPDGRILQWVYRKGGAPGPGRLSTWAPPKAVGPIQLSLDHADPKGGFRLFFDQVKVTTADGKEFTAGK